MKPPYDITLNILKLISSISEKIGEINSRYLDKPSPELRKQNKIKTIHHSLKIEGNTLTEDQITGLIEDKRVIGPQKDIKEVLNAIAIYENLSSFNPTSEKSFMKAHKVLMNELIQGAGRYRKESVGLVKGNKVAHLAPPYNNVPFLMKDLFNYLKDPDELMLIKSCVFHYEMEFIHPFLDGNGRMGRFWQTLLLLQEYEVFEYLPFETLISQTQSEYYNVLSECDKSGNSTLFIEYMLSVINKSIGQLLNSNYRLLTQEDRLNYFISKGIIKFSRKDYLNVFKNISTATASRDLKKALHDGLFEKFGDLNKTVYKLKTKFNRENP